MVDIYRAIYGEHHYLLGIALSNLAGVYMGRQEWPRAEKLFRQVIHLFTETQSAHHINTGIARIKLGRTLLHERRFGEAESEIPQRIRHSDQANGCEGDLARERSPGPGGRVCPLTAARASCEVRAELAAAASAHNLRTRY